MSPANAAIIDEAYIAPIKSILFIDDKFPTHADLLKKSLTTDKEEEHIEANLRDIAAENLFNNEEDNAHNGNIGIDEVQEEYNRSIDEHVLRLTQSCRANGYIFDVENNLEYIKKDEYAFINKSDLVVLDYFLTEGEDSSHALRIIHSLAESKRYNLIIVHSTKEKTEVASQILFSMKNIRYNDVDRHFLNNPERIENIVSSNLLQILDGDQTHRNEIYEILPVDQRKKARNFINKLICDHFKNTKPSEKNLVLKSNISSSRTPWIAANNAFVVVTQKNMASEQDINSLIAELKEALTEYNPGIITKSLNHIANVSKENIYEILNSAFATPEIRAAVLYTALNGISSVDSHPHRASIIANRITHAILSGVKSDIALKASSFCTKCVESLKLEENLRVHDACILSEQANCETLNMFLHANAKACCEERPQHAITTGSIFTHNKQTWMCVTPSCDIARGENYTSVSMIAIEAIRLSKCGPQGKIDAVEFATHGRYIFIRNGTDVDVFCTYNGSKTGLHIGNFFIRGSTFLDSENMIRLFTFDADEYGACILSEPCKVIAQLRSDYASRFLTEKGAWKSRIGVDFFPYKAE